MVLLAELIVITVVETMRNLVNAHQYRDDILSHIHITECYPNQKQ